MKKSYQIEVPATAENITALTNANIDFTLFEVNEVRKSSESFACGSNFATTEIILKETDQMDDKEYTDQQLKNYCAGLQKNLPHVMQKIVKL